MNHAELFGSSKRLQLEDGKLVEHWDSVQPIPSNSRNGRRMV